MHARRLWVATTSSHAARRLVQVVPEGGDQHPNAGPGDLILHVVVNDHAQFHRDGDDLHVDVKISLQQVCVAWTLLRARCEPDCLFAHLAGAR